MAAVTPACPTCGCPDLQAEARVHATTLEFVAFTEGSAFYCPECDVEFHDPRVLRIPAAEPPTKEQRDGDDEEGA